LFGHADTRAVKNVASAEADVIVLQELTPEAARSLVAAGMDEEFPYRTLDPRPAAGGIGIYSRYPLSDVTNIPGYELAMVSATLRIDDARPLTVVSMHFAAPWPQPINGWHNDFGKFPKTMSKLAADAAGNPILIGGDFNATIDMSPFRALLTNGYRDAAEQSGAGRERTFPANRPYPAFMGIDHFITRDCTATSSHTVEIPGTDHMALLATIMLPRGEHSSGDGGSLPGSVS
jgi:endonuclease/exonuclease/phosphatase family metal-dependent hydrolase